MRTQGSILGTARRDNLHIMTYNVRFDRAGTLPGEADYWPERVPALRELLRAEHPTVLGVQEAQFEQLEQVRAALPGRYRSIGYGRNGGSAGEHSAILYDTRRLRLLEWDQFWLSDRPTEIGSCTWGNHVPRIVTWGRFTQLYTGRELAVINTHFDHESENARTRSARSVAELVDVFAGLPVVLVGDFNAAAPHSPQFRLLTGSGDLADTWVTAAERRTECFGTRNDYKDPLPGARRIDWILASPGFEVLAAAINPLRFEGRYPSDHLPVQALLRPVG